jgi:hypothetical protein
MRSFLSLRSRRALVANQHARMERAAAPRPGFTAAENVAPPDPVAAAYVFDSSDIAERAALTSPCAHRRSRAVIATRLSVVRHAEVRASNRRPAAGAAANAAITLASAIQFLFSAIVASMPALV